MPKPVIFSDDRTDAERFDPRKSRGSLDPSRIPGYAEIVRANDLNKADDLEFRSRNAGRTKEDYFKLIGAQPQDLPVQFAWLRVSGPGGADSLSAQREVDRAKNEEGFRLATVEVLEKYGYGFPPTARRAEDGTIRRGADTALFYRDGEVARRWERYYAEETARREGVSLPATFSDGDYRTETFVDEEHETIEVTH